MKDKKPIIGLALLFLLLTLGLFFGGTKQEPGFDLDDMPELIVFKECLARQELFRDVEICDCAELVGHIEWCSGDIKY